MDKYAFIAIKEKWVSSENYKDPIQQQVEILGVAKLGKKSVVKKLFLVKSHAEFDDSIFNGFIPYQEKKETFLQKKAYTAAKMPFDNPFTVIM